MLKLAWKLLLYLTLLQWCSFEIGQSSFYVLNYLSWEYSMTKWKLQFGIEWSFKMRYCINFYLNWHKKFKESKLKLQNVLNKKQTFKSNPLNFLYRITVPHFKASFNAKVESPWLKHAVIFTLPSAVLKTNYLVHKTELV